MCLCCVHVPPCPSWSSSILLQDDDEWDDYRENKKDYTGLKIENLTVQETKTEEEEEEETEVGRKGVGQQWKTVRLVFFVLLKAKPVFLVFFVLPWSPKSYLRL